MVSAYKIENHFISIDLQHSDPKWQIWDYKSQEWNDTTARYPCIPNIKVFDFYFRTIFLHLI